MQSTIVESLFNDMSTSLGHFVSSLRGGHKKLIQERKGEKRNKEEEMKSKRHCRNRRNINMTLLLPAGSTHNIPFMP